MIQIDLFKIIKDKKMRLLYENISLHLNHMENTDDKDKLNTYAKRILAFKNGYTDKDKLFLMLRKNVLAYPHIYIDFLYEFAQQKMYYLEHKRMKRLDDLFQHAELQSTFGYLLLIVDQHAQNHLELIKQISRIDMLFMILTDFKQLKLKNKALFPIQLLEDYKVEESLQGTYMINEGFLSLWRFLFYKLQKMVDALKPDLFMFEKTDSDLIKYMINQNMKQLKLMIEMS